MPIAVCREVEPCRPSVHLRLPRNSTERRWSTLDEWWVNNSATCYRVDRRARPVLRLTGEGVRGTLPARGPCPLSSSSKKRGPLLRGRIQGSKLGGLTSAATVNNRRCGRRQGREHHYSPLQRAPGPSLATRLLPRLIHCSGSK